MRSILSRSCFSSSRELRNGGGGGGGGDRTHVYLNVYDLTPINNYLYWFGLGIYHSGIEDVPNFLEVIVSDTLVHGMEYGFGALDYSSTGVFQVEPKSCPGFIYRRSVWLGTTDVSPSDFHLFLEHLSGKYRGDTYHLTAKNCNHFTDDVCMQLTGKHIPGWVNRLARFGSFCNCLLPVNIHVTTVRHLPDHPYSDGSDSSAFSVMDETDDEQLDHHLLISPPDSDTAHSRD